MSRNRRRMALWVKLAAAAFVCVLVPAYWRHYGPSNFLWFSDLALFMVVAALWLEGWRPAAARWLASMAAVAVLLLELAWNVDFFARLLFGARLLDLAGYMFEPHRPLFMRLLSLFHVAMPPLLLWTVRPLGYDRRAWLAQTAVAWAVLPLTYWLTDPADNVNWVFGPGSAPQKWMPPPLYLALLMIFFPLCVYLPTHLLLRWLFAPGGKTEPGTETPP